MLRAPTFLAVLLLPSRAVAEVCDKVAGDWWRPEDGPVDAWSWSSAGRLFTIVVATLLLTWLFRSRGLAWIAASVMGVMAAFYALAAVIDDNGITRSAISEGCLSPDGPRLAVMTALIFMLVSALLVVAGASPLARSQQR